MENQQKTMIKNVIRIILATISCGYIIVFVSFLTFVWTGLSNIHGNKSFFELIWESLPGIILVVGTFVIYFGLLKNYFWSIVSYTVLLVISLSIILYFISVGFVTNSNLIDFSIYTVIPGIYFWLNRKQFN